MSYRINSLEDYRLKYEQSVENPDQFWNEVAESFQWRKKWDKTLEFDFNGADFKWFVNGKLNITENCLDRHLEENGERIAFYWEPNNPKDSAHTITYNQLHQKVCQFANALENTGIKKGDIVCLYMPMIPELIIAILAIARIGAIHSVVFAGFSSHALADRINDAKARMVITTDGMYRGAKKMSVKKVVDEALATCTSIEHVVTKKYTNEDITWNEGIDLDWDEISNDADKTHEAVEMDAEDPLFILYTSGSTGKPKGVVHTCGGFMVYTAYSFLNVFQYNENDVFWCTADVGWITGHSYIAYGPLLNCATSVMFEGIPTYPDAGRFWDVVDKYKVNQFYTAPTAIRALMARGNEFVDNNDLSSLKVLGTVGEPINEEAWVWYHEKVGRNNCPIVDTWWQTETGGIMLSGLGDISQQKPSYAGLPLPGIQPALLNKDGNEITKPDEEGYLVIKYPWPSIIRTTYGNHERCKTTYFSHYPNVYFTGDGAKFDENGMFRVIGRVDDVINVSGHRFGTAEIEDAIDTNEYVVESAVVGYPHEIKGQAIYAFVICEIGDEDEELIIDSIVSTVVDEIGKIAKPEKIQICEGLPKTRSGKIMRRILRKIAEKTTDSIGDTSTLLDPDVVDKIISGSK